MRRAALVVFGSHGTPSSQFWTLTRELLRLRHHADGDLHAAVVRSSLDPDETLELMRRGAREERIAGDVASALASGVTSSPALFIDGARVRERWRRPSITSGNTARAQMV